MSILIKTFGTDYTLGFYLYHIHDVKEDSCFTYDKKNSTSENYEISKF